MTSTPATGTRRKRGRWRSDILVFAFALFVVLGMVAGAVRWAAVVPWPITALQIVAGLGLLAVGISTLAFGPRHPRALLSYAFGVPLVEAISETSRMT